ncbi:MAG: ribonuclease H-like domain-containing protein [Firmicutes bacterium]|nr:ribonuclease H-like domain-containing protein [Bacillota bacterium]MDD4793219.1 ribonuclease H-like domain-containing protein [Bacillota bacterium]
MHDFPRGAVVTNSSGSCIGIEKEMEAEPLAPIAPARAAISRIASNLQLVYGIGPVREAELKRDGYTTLFDLLVHERWGRGARPIVEALERSDRQALSSCGVPDLDLLALCAPDEVVFLDIETTGLSSTSTLFMVGMIIPSEQGLILHQLFARDYEEEPAVLEETLVRLNGVRAVVTYNGKRFDMPFIRRRLAYYGRDDDPQTSVIDLCPPARRRFSFALPNCRLSTIQTMVLDCPRDGDIPGFLIPDLYNHWVRTGDADTILPVLDHNELDLIAMVDLLPLLI